MKINYLLLIFVFFLASKNLKANEVFDKGKIIFLGQGNCATCHVLSDAEASGNIGPNLNEIRPNIARIVKAVTNGIGVMPAYAGYLTSEEIAAVSHYVYMSTNK